MSLSDVIRSSFVEAEPVIELLDHSNNFVADISDDLLDGEVSHDNLAQVSGNIRLRIQGDYTWEAFRIRVSLKLTGLVNGILESHTTALGIYIPETPANSDRSVIPPSYEVEGYSAPYIFKTPRINSYDVPSGTAYLTAVQDLLDEIAWPLVTIDPTEAAAVTPSNFVWLLDQDNTYLSIINDLLLGINYEELFASRDGYVTARPYIFPQDKAVTWTFNTASDQSILIDPVVVTKDFAEVPNRWVFIRDDPEQPIPSEGDGIYTVTNTSSGPASFTARGFYRTQIVPIDFVSSQAALVAAGDRIVNRAKYPLESVTLSSSPVPIIFHYDVVAITAPEYGFSNTKFFVKDWTLNLRELSHSFNLQKVPLL